MFEWLEHLDDQQRAVATFEGGPLRVLAGAGTGKTTALTARVCRLLAAGTPAERVLLLTFTRRAAREMVARSEALLARSGVRARTGRVQGGTFHSVAHRTLRRHATRLGLADGFSVLDPADAGDVVDLVRDELLSTAAQRWRVVRQWALFGALALGAACLNPYGPEMILVTFRTVALGSALLTITEWRPPDFSHLGPYEIIVLGGIAAALLYGVRLPWLRLVMLLGVLHLSLSQARHADLLGMLAPIFIARPLAMQFAALARRADYEVRASVWGPSLAAAAIVAALGLTMLRQDLAPPAHNTPAAALRAIDAAHAGPILNDYDFGAYLDFVGIPAFIDGRTELYGAAFTLRYDRALKLANLPDFLTLLDENHIRTTLLAPNTPAVALLDRLPEWKRVYADEIAVVHQRTGG